MFLVEGEKCVSEALGSKWCLEKLLVNIFDFEKYAGEYGDKCLNVSDSVIEALSDSKSPQGIIAVVRKKNFEPVFEGLTVVLEDVSDPTNIGSIVRSADAMGASCVVLSDHCADIYSARSVRASMGSLFHIPVLISDIIGYVSEFRKNGKVICGHLRGKDTFDVCANTCIVVGNESRGISDSLSQMCDLRYRIPMTGKAESLNVGVAAGIMLYEAQKNMKGFLR